MKGLCVPSLLAAVAVALHGGGENGIDGRGAPTIVTTSSFPDMPWVPPPATSPELIPFLRDTSRPKLAFSSYIGWYEDGGLNETSLFEQVEAMATRMRPHGWTHVMNDYGWQVCGSTFNISPMSTPTQVGCYHVDEFGRLLPDPQRYPSTAPNGSWKPFIDKVHAQGIAFGLHLIHGIPIIAAQKKLPVLGTNFTIDELVASHCTTFIADHWMMNASHPGARAYYDSVVSKWAEEGLDFIYLDGVEGPGTCGCQIGAVALLADSLRRLGNGMFMYTSYGPPDPTYGCSYAALSELAPYVRVGTDTVDAWFGSYEYHFSAYTRLVAPSVGPNHFGDLAGLWVGKVHCPLNSQGCKPGPDFYVPSNESVLTKDEVISYASLNAMFRSSWWPAGALSEMDDFAFSLLTNDAMIRITMNSKNNRQVPTSPSTPVSSWTGPGVVWTADDRTENWKYVMLVNMCPCSAGLGCNPACGAASNGLDVDVDFITLGLPLSTTCDVTELWGNQHMGKVFQKLHVTLRSHASHVVKLSNCTSLVQTTEAWPSQVDYDQTSTVMIL